MQAPETWTYESVLKHIDELCNVWQGPELPRAVATNEEMKSRYEEAAGSQGFFEPFIWKFRSFAKARAEQSRRYVALNPFPYVHKDELV